jgi:hypothetical protein
VAEDDAPSPFLQELSNELEKLSTPPEHRDRLRDLAVEDWRNRNPDKL